MILHNVKTFFKRYLFYNNDFKKKFENLKALAIFLSHHNIEFYLCGGFSIFVLNNAAHRKSNDIDLYVEDRDIERLMDILSDNNTTVLKKHRHKEIFFWWNNVAYNVYPFGRKGDLVSCFDEWQKITLAMPEQYLRDKSIDDNIFRKYKIRIWNPTHTFLFYALTKNAISKKLDFYYLKKHISKEHMSKILELNPQYKNTFDPSLFNYSFGRWLKDELRCIMTNFKEEPGVHYV